MRGGQYSGGGVDWPLCVPPTVERDRRACTLGLHPVARKLLLISRPAEGKEAELT